MLIIDFLILWAKLGFNGNFLASSNAELEQNLMKSLVSNRLNLQRGSFMLRVMKNFLAPKWEEVTSAAEGIVRRNKLLSAEYS